MRYAALTVLLLALPQMASAQDVTGTINLTGTVAGRCSVSGGGLAFADTINLGELSGPDGRIRPDLTDGAPDGSRNFSVLCTSATPRVILSATRMSTGSTAPTGYSNVLDYTAEVRVQQSEGTPPAITYVTASALPPPTNVQLTGPLANIADNITLSVHTFGTDAGALLIAGDYTGTITVTISPS